MPLRVYLVKTSVVMAGVRQTSVGDESQMGQEAKAGGKSIRKEARESIRDEDQGWSKERRNK